jgi:ribosomal protein S18 acetylase RimI-like enzyme
MVDPQRLGRGAGKAMGLHCLQQARHTGFLAIQFNFVVSTNTAAVGLWEQLGFSIVGRLPQVYRHAELGLVDAFVMHRFLDDVAVQGLPDSG